MSDIDVFACDDLSAALTAWELSPPSPGDLLPESARAALRVDPASLLEHSVSHNIMPQLLRPVVGSYLAGGGHITLRTNADASLCVRELQLESLSHDELLAVGRSTSCLHNIKLIKMHRAQLSADSVGFFTAPTLQATLQTLSLQKSSRLTTKVVRQLVVLQQLTHLDVSYSSSLRPTALPYIAQLRNLEYLDIRSLQNHPHGPRAITIPGEFANLASLKVLKLGYHRVSSLAPLRHLVSLQELEMREVEYPKRDLRHLASLEHLHTLTFDCLTTCLRGIGRLRSLTTLSLPRQLTPEDADEFSTELPVSTLNVPALRTRLPTEAFQRLCSMPTLTSLRAQQVNLETLECIANASKTTLKLLQVSVIPGVSAFSVFPEFSALEHLTADVGHHTDAGLVLRSVSSLIQLQHLDLSHMANLNVECLRPLLACKKLKHLSLDATSYEDTIFEVFKVMKVLEHLCCIIRCGVTFSDVAAMHLASMPQLRVVRFKQRGEETERFKRALPFLTIR